MSAGEYFACKKKLIPEILEAYRQAGRRSMTSSCIEGAGSPAEINLQEGRHCEYGDGPDGRTPRCSWPGTSTGEACSPSFCGTLQLLEPEEREMDEGADHQ